MAPIICDLKFDYKLAKTAFEVLFAGFTMLEKQGIVKIGKLTDENDFRSHGGYCHNSVIEVSAQGKKLALDIADGYQSFQHREMFDCCLDGLDAYFKVAFSPDFQVGMRNEKKVFPLGFTVSSTCRGNPLSSPFFNVNSLLGFARAVYHLPRTVKRNRANDFDNFISHNSYDKYRFVYWTRLWDPTPVSPEKYQKFYPYLSLEEARIWADKTTAMFTDVNDQRIRIIRNMKEHFGDDFVYGLYPNEFAHELCPELIAPNPLVDTRPAFLNALRQGYICIGSYGMHYCLGAKIAEFMSAGRAMLLQPQAYTQPVPLIDGVHFIEYSTPDILPSKAEKLIGDIGLIKTMEKANSDYFEKNCRPDTLILNALSKVFPEKKLIF